MTLPGSDFAGALGSNTPITYLSASPFDVEDFRWLKQRISRKVRAKATIPNVGLARFRVAAAARRGYPYLLRCDTSVLNRHRFLLTFVPCSIPLSKRPAQHSFTVSVVRKRGRYTKFWESLGVRSAIKLVKLHPLVEQGNDI